MFNNIKLELEDKETLAITSYHVIADIGVNIPSRGVNVDIESYSRKKAYQNGKRPVSRISCYFEFVSDNEIPRYQDVLSFLVSNEASPLFGGVLDELDEEKTNNESVAGQETTAEVENVGK